MLSYLNNNTSNEKNYIYKKTNIEYIKLIIHIILLGISKTLLDMPT